MVACANDCRLSSLGCAGRSRSLSYANGATLAERQVKARIPSMQTVFQEPYRPEIGIIIVNYNSAQATAQLVADLQRQEHPGYALSIIVADNGPSASDLSSIKNAYRNSPIIRFEVMPHNLGYFGAAHFSLNTVWKDRSFDWLIVSNADIRMLQSDFCSRLAHLVSGVDAVIAPRIVSGRTGLDQNPIQTRRPSALRINLHRIISRVPFLFWLMQAQSTLRLAIKSRLHRKPPQLATESTRIYAPHGAFIIFSKEYFERGGSLNAGAFLYAEEIFVAETCRSLGLGVVYSPSFEVLHEEHVSTKMHPDIRHFQAAAADYCAREFVAQPTVKKPE